MDIRMPEVGESITEGTVATWLIKEGDQVQAGDILVEVETDKVNIEIQADQAGVVTSILKQSGDNINVGETLAILQEGATGAAPVATEQPAATPQAQTSAPAAAASSREETVAPRLERETDSHTLASPSVRRQAREQGIALDAATQTPLNTPATTPAVPAAAPAVAPAAAETHAAPRSVRVKMSRRRRTIAKRLVDAQHTAAMLTTFNEVDMTAVMDLRKRRQATFVEANDIKLGFMSFFVKAVVAALKKFPLLNAEIDQEEIIVKKFFDIGIAVSAQEGLVVPVVRDADRMSFGEIEKEIRDLAVKARENQLELSDLQGGSFTITNGGTFGSLLSTPILNSPQVGILGMHSIQLRPVAIDATTIENRPMMYIALTYDHRIVDGSEAVRFLVTIKQLLEDPERLLLEG